MLPKRVSAVIIQDKKILLVSNEKTPLFWTPGGKVEEQESHEEAMKRELQEELTLSFVSMKAYMNYKTMHDFLKKEQQVHCYFVTCNGTPEPSQEITKYGWFSKDKLPKLVLGTKTYLIPRLIKDGLL